MKAKILLTLVVTTILILNKKVNCGNTDSLLTLVNDLENELKTRVAYTESAYQSRCNNSCPATYMSCSIQMPDLQCNEAFNRTDCGCYNLQGSMVANQSLVSVLNPGETPTQGETEIICALKGLDTIFESTAKKFSQIRWQYAGAYNGVDRSFPGKLICNYDPRFRLWYVAGATGAKNVMIIFDRSGSMANEKLAMAKTAAKAVVNTLTIADWVGLVLFNAEATVETDTLLRATSTNKQKIIDLIDAMITGGGTNFEDAFRKSYNTIANTQSDDMGSIACQTILLFLTDGIPTAGETNSTKLVAILDELESEYKINATLISYAYGSDANPNFLVDLSCSRNGLTENIQVYSNLPEAMSNYYLLIASGMTRDNVTWTAPYEDAFGLGEMITASLPFYDRVNSDPPKLLGVSGVDITLSQLLQYVSADSVMKQLTERSSGCNKSNLTFCQLQQLRGNYKCPTKTSCPTDDTFNYSPLCSSYSYYPFVEGTEVDKNPQNSQACCGVNMCIVKTGVIIGSIVGGFLFIFGSIYFGIWAKKRCEQLKEEKEFLKREEEERERDMQERATRNKRPSSKRISQSRNEYQIVEDRNIIQLVDIQLEYPDEQVVGGISSDVQ